MQDELHYETHYTYPFECMFTFAFFKSLNVKFWKLFNLPSAAYTKYDSLHIHEDHYSSIVLSFTIYLIVNKTLIFMIYELYHNAYYILFLRFVFNEIFCDYKHTIQIQTAIAIWNIYAQVFCVHELDFNMIIIYHIYKITRKYYVCILHIIYGMEIYYLFKVALVWYMVSLKYS